MKKPVEILRRFSRAQTASMTRSVKQNKSARNLKEDIRRGPQLLQDYELRRAWNRLQKTPFTLAEAFGEEKEESATT